MSDIAIRTVGLSKRYRLGGPRPSYYTLRDRLAEMVARPFRGARAGSADSTFWALKDVSFEVKRGQVLGIIGHNGAGKTTVLKILSRITEPTEGYAEIHGRVGSLLEVGTGFHPELSGRENVYLNGAVLGMHRAETARKFDEIVAFAGIEAFIDTPVKRYSSGMYIRLAFAVAAHLEPEILMVDEVLAVGDYQFQRKCLGKMASVTQEGRTVVFVSHNLQALRKLCPSTVLLERGRIKSIGPTAAIIDEYIESDQGVMSERRFDGAEGDVPEGIRLEAVRVLNPESRLSQVHYVEDPTQLVVDFRLEKPLDLMAVNFKVYKDGMIAFTLPGAESVYKAGLGDRPGRMRVTAAIPPNLLNVGVHHVEVEFGLGYGRRLGTFPSVVSFMTTEREAADETDEGDDFAFSMRHRRLAGIVRPVAEWRCEYLGR